MRPFKILPLLFTLWFTRGNAQQNFTLYNMGSVPQRSWMNPALLPECKWHLGIPALNSLYVHASTSGFNFSNIWKATEIGIGDTSVLNFNKLLNVLDKKNYISVKVEQTWLHGGLRWKNHYFNANITEKGAVKISLPKDLFRFVIDGNGGQNLGSTFHFDLGAQAIHYREFGFGYAYTYRDQITVGARLKYLRGLNVVDLNKANLSVQTRSGDYAWLLSSDVELNTASSAFRILNTDTTRPNDFNGRRLYSGVRNGGLGLDLGATYKVTDKLSVNASILDIGFIRWTQNTGSWVSHDPRATFVFDGIHISSKDTNSDFGQYIENLADSMIHTFRLDTLHRKFSTGLSTEFFIGANYKLMKKLELSALLYGDFFNKRFYPGLTLGMRYTPWRALSVNVTNTMYSNGWFNPGLGIAVKGGPVQFYTVADNFLAPVMLSRLRSMNVRFGINLVFGHPSGTAPAKTEPAETDPVTF
ncbi:MAG: hypothetical protein JNL57_11270 [Bacteroidetes bacterium]|nr:hypothetical protein [Bacteroidota bacterium]